MNYYKGQWVIILRLGSRRIIKSVIGVGAAAAILAGLWYSSQRSQPVSAVVRVGVDHSPPY